MNTMKFFKTNNFFALKMTKLSTLVVAVLLAIGLTSCEKEQIEAAAPADRTMKVRMTDAPGDFAALNVEITKVEVFSRSEGWVTLENQSQIHDVTELTNGKEVVIAAAANLKAELYTELRLTYGVASSLSLELFSGTTIDHNLAIQSSTVIPIEANLESQNGLSLLIDFHAAESVIESAGEYFLDPVVTWVEDSRTGVQGELEAQTSAAIMLMTEGGNGEISFSTLTDAQGRFLIRGVEAGTYDLLVQFRDGANELKEMTIEGVVVTEGQITQMGSLSAG